MIEHKYSLENLSYEDVKKIINFNRRNKTKAVFFGACEICGRKFERKKPTEKKMLLCTKCLTKKNLEEKYGDLKEYYKMCREKQKKTNLEKYRAECTFQSQIVKEKIKDSLTAKYGKGKRIENPSQVSEIKEKIKKTNLEKYGTEYYIVSKDAREKTKTTSLKKYGTESPNSSEIVKNNKRQSCLKKYGVTNINKLPETQNKITATCLEKYGRRWNVYKYYYDDNKFDSSWEQYFVGEKVHHYEPDFLINGKLYEVKGSHLINKDGYLIDTYKTKKILYEKTEAIKKNEVCILTEESTLLKQAFDFFETLNIDLEELKK